MFDYIKGTLIQASPSSAIIDIQGLGYRLQIPLNNFSKLPQLGSAILFYLSLIIREDSHKFFGFLTQQERDLFEILIGISGIGPKTALALIGHMEIAELQAAIAGGNIALVCKIPGIGKKTAERLIVEMRDKVFSSSSNSHTASKDQEPGIISDAINALVNLGYNLSQAQKAVKASIAKPEQKLELATLITSALRHM